MSASTSSTDIVNLALDILKTENISDVEMPADDDIAAVMNRWYDDIRQNALEGFPWVFATKRAELPLNATAPAFGYDDAYVLPNDYLSLAFISDEYIPLSQWDYTIENGQILIDNGGGASLEVGYIYDVTNAGKFSPSFKLYLAYLLAYHTVAKLVGNTSVIGWVQKALQREEIQAKAKNGRNNPPKGYRRVEMLSARRGQIWSR